ncbi:hypothetical protein FRC02_011691 [Tulasnella sp. 418]|nr:hypothetical protein FRC02_011691 [Tulasnella sp. 418]
MKAAHLMFDDDETLRELRLDRKIEYNQPKHFSGFSDVCPGTLIMESGNLEVAIKVLRLKKSNNSISKRPDDQRFMMRFKREVLLWRRLKHRNIVPLLGYATHPSGWPAMVSPWYPNGNVVEYLAQQRDPNRTSLASDVARALTYLHSIPVVHGDIKGENVLVDISGSASLCDFGLSQFVEDADHIHGFTTTNAYAGGTDLYLSPELVNGEGKTTMSDMWALGCLIVLCKCQILTDQTPHHAINNRLKFLIAITAGEVPHKTRNIAINEGLWDSLTRCWSTAPLERPNISQIAAHFIPSSDVMDDREDDIHFNASVDHRKQSLQNHNLGKGEDEDCSVSRPERENYPRSNPHLVSPFGERFEVTTTVSLGTSKSGPLSNSEDPSSGNLELSKQSYQPGQKRDLRKGGDTDYSASPPENYLQNISHLVSPSGECVEVTSPVPLGRYSFAKSMSYGAKVPTSGSEELVEQLEDIPLCFYLLVIGNEKYAALIDDNLQCRWLKSLSELRCFMQAHNVVRKNHLEAGPVETYAIGGKNDETWYCRYLGKCLVLDVTPFTNEAFWNEQWVVKVLWVLALLSNKRRTKRAYECCLPTKSTFARWDKVE